MLNPTYSFISSICFNVHSLRVLKTKVELFNLLLLSVKGAAHTGCTAVTFFLLFLSKPLEFISGFLSPWLREKHLLYMMSCRSLLNTAINIWPEIQGGNETFSL